MAADLLRFLVPPGEADMLLDSPGVSKAAAAAAASAHPASPLAAARQPFEQQQATQQVAQQQQQEQGAAAAPQQQSGGGGWFWGLFGGGSSSEDSSTEGPSVPTNPPPPAAQHTAQPPAQQQQQAEQAGEDTAAASEAWRMTAQHAWKMLDAGALRWVGGQVQLFCMGRVIALHCHGLRPSAGSHSSTSRGLCCSCSCCCHALSCAPCLAHAVGCGAHPPTPPPPGRPPPAGGPPPRRARWQACQAACRPCWPPPPARPPLLPPTWCLARQPLRQRCLWLQTSLHRRMQRQRRRCWRTQSCFCKVRRVGWGAAAGGAGGHTAKAARDCCCCCRHTCGFLLLGLHCTCALPDAGSAACLPTLRLSRRPAAFVSLQCARTRGA